MNYTELSPDKKRDYDRRVLKGLGELYTWTYLDIEEKTVEETDAEGGVTKSKKDVVVEKSKQFYVGRMSLFQTSGVISILSAVFVNGNDFKEQTERKDNLAFVEFLDEYHLSLLLSTILDVEREWFLGDEFSVEQAMDVLGIFFKYNNFFALLNKVGTIAQGMGLGAEQVRKAALGG